MVHVDPFGPIALALIRVGELLQARGAPATIVVVGGAAMNLHGFVHRVTTDVDVIATAIRPGPDSAAELVPPEPLPETLQRAAATVARDLGLRPDWLNTGPALQWRQGLPDGMGARIAWRRFAALEVGLADRIDLIFLKLYAAADHTGPGSVHFQDLLALRPTPAELAAAAAWVTQQDPTEAFATTVRKVMEHVGTHRDTH